MLSNGNSLNITYSIVYSMQGALQQTSTSFLATTRSSLSKKGTLKEEEPG